MQERVGATVEATASDRGATGLGATGLGATGLGATLFLPLDGTLIL